MGVGGMSKTPVSSQDITAAARQVCSLDELQQMSRIQLGNLGTVIARRLAKDGPPPTVDELQGLKELALEHLWHPAMDAVSTPRTPPSQPDTSDPRDLNQAAKRLQQEMVRAMRGD